VARARCRRVRCAAARRNVLDDSTRRGWMPCRDRFRAVAAGLDRVQTPDRRAALAGRRPLVAGREPRSGIPWGTFYRCAPRPERRLVVLDHSSRAAALDAAGVRRPAGERAASVGCTPADRGPGAGIARSPAAMRTVRERRHEAAKMCRNSANFRRGGQSIRAVLGGRSGGTFRPAFRPREDAGR
jgi:hypothetical protein